MQIRTTHHYPQFQLDVATALEQHFDEAGITVTFSETKEAPRERLIFFFNIIVSLLGTMSVIIAAVGGLGLMGTMSINVIERVREIGVIRAIGASNQAVLQIIIVEGLFIRSLTLLHFMAVGLEVEPP